MKEAILLICDSTGRSEISTHCSDDGKIAVLAATHEIYPKFHSCPCYYIYKLPSKEANAMLVLQVIFQKGFEMSDGRYVCVLFRNDIIDDGLV